MEDATKSDRAVEAAKKLYDLLGDRDREALRVFEEAVEKENHGSMSDALDLYRKAFKLNDKVDLLYRKTQLPKKIHQLKQVEGKNSGVKLDEDKIRKINVEELLHSFHDAEPQPPSEEDAIKFAGAGENGEDVSVVKPISKLIHLDDDIWLSVFKILLVAQPEAWVNFALTCKKFAYLGFSSSILWQKLCDLIYKNQVYEENQSAIKTFLRQHEADNVEDDDFSKKPFEVPEDVLPVPKDLSKVVVNYDYSWKYMLTQRPFVKFNGCYISVINYFSEGSNDFSSSWTNPVKTITYYRYIRFYPDGKCLKVLTVLEPYRVVPFLARHNKTKSLTAHLDGNKISDHVKEGHRIYHGTWTISTDGEVHLEIAEGAVSYQIFHYHFYVKSSGSMHKFNKLNWNKYYAIRKLMYSGDNRQGEMSMFPIKNEKPFRFIRVKSFASDPVA